MRSDLDSFRLSEELFWQTTTSQLPKTVFEPGESMLSSRNRSNSTQMRWNFWRTTTCKDASSRLGSTQLCRGPQSLFSVPRSKERAAGLICASLSKRHLRLQSKIKNTRVYKSGTLSWEISGSSQRSLLCSKRHKIWPAKLRKSKPAWIGRWSCSLYKRCLTPMMQVSARKAS